jgi:hypothetical protein
VAEPFKGEAMSKRLYTVEIEAYSRNPAGFEGSCGRRTPIRRSLALTKCRV